MANAWIAGVFCPGLQDDEIVQEVFNLFTNSRELLSFLSHSSPDFAFKNLSHTRLCDLRFCGQ